MQFKLPRISHLSPTMVLLGVVAIAACSDTVDQLPGTGRSLGGTWSGEGTNGGSQYVPSGVPSLGDGGTPTPVSLGGGAVLTSKADAAKALFDRLYPGLKTACGSCHATGAGGAPKFLDANNPYKSITSFQGIVVPDPSTSLMMLVGISLGHPGTTLTGDLRNQVTAWLQAEADSLPVAKVNTSDTVAINAGANSVDLSKVGQGIDGTKLVFNATMTGTTLALTGIQLQAPAGTAIEVSHPLFVFVSNGVETPDPVDNFSAIDQTVSAGQTITMSPGAAFFTDVAPGSQVRIQFKSITPAAAASADAGGGGCKSLATFQSSAEPELKNLCVQCHGGGNKGATSAMDLSQLGKDDGAACAQALNKVNLGDKPNSAIILTPGGGNGHPNVGGFDQNTHAQAMLGWINNE